MRKILVVIHNFKSITMISLLGLFLSACVSNGSVITESRPIEPKPANPQPSEQDRVVVDGKVLPLPKERQISTYSLPTEQPVSSVVRNLTHRAQDQSRAGNYDGAANSLERALRIEPRNSKLWNQLADVRYLQEAWKKAIQLAAKSNTLAGSDKTLRRENWYLMSNAYRALGDSSSEQKYRDKLNNP